MTSRPFWPSAAVLVAIGVIGPMACFPVTQGAACTTDENCPTGQRCVALVCAVSGGTGGGSGGGTAGGSGSDGGVGGGAGVGGGTGGTGGGGGSGGGVGVGGGAGGGGGGGTVDAGPTDAGVGEASFGSNACFDGTDNDGDTLTDCTDPDCAGAACRASLGDCDTKEVCTNLTCPGDTLLPAATICRAKSGECDLDEVCSGADAGCPQDVMLGTGTTCRGAQGPCDVAEKCTGGADCPPDVLEPSTKLCGAGNTECDLPESCTGLDAGCPPDLLQPSTFTCRASVGGCDSAELCNGAKTCPADVNACPSTQYCGGSACVAKLANGGTCASASQCTSGNCVRENASDPNGVCCDTACGELCDSCNQAVSLGQCKPSPATVSCRAAVNTCDAEEKCSGASAQCPVNGFASNATPCALASCSNGSFTSVANCDGSGACNPPATVSCGFYACNGPVCFTTCTLDTQCTSTSYCSGGSCKPKLANGGICSSGNGCTSGNCADGLCCDGACSGRCESCNLAASPGQCKPSGVNTDPDNECGAYTCDGAGACRTACGSQPACSPICKAANFCQGGACVPDRASGACGNSCECATGSCTDGYCCNTPCAGACQACNLLGQEGSCRPQVVGTDPENGCGAYTCDGAGACNASCSPALSCPTACKAAAYCTAAGCGPDLGNGNACTASCQCATGSCGTFYVDSDNDSYGAGAPVQFCGTMPPFGYSANNTDCNDGSAAFNPGATELPGDEVDQNCDGREVCFLDADNDGYRLITTILSNDPDCADPQEARGSKPTGDCCDSDPNAFPGQTNYFPTTRTGCASAPLGYDFNCDNVQTQRYPTTASTSAICHAIGGGCILDNNPGWVGAVPACAGGFASFYDCSATCTSVTVTRQQTCR